MMIKSVSIIACACSWIHRGAILFILVQSCWTNVHSFHFKVPTKVGGKKHNPRFVVPVISETLPFHVYVVQEPLLWSFCLRVIDWLSYSAIYSALLQIRLQLSQHTICWIKSKLPPLPFDGGDANCFWSDTLETIKCWWYKWSEAHWIIGNQFLKKHGKSTFWWRWC